MVSFKRLFTSIGNGIKRRLRNIQAGYDILRKQNDNDHWKYATDEASSALDTYETRMRIKRLCRLEFRNNPHLKGLVLKMAHEVVGGGPQLEIIPDRVTSASTRAANRLEKTWEEHACETKFAQKLRLTEIEKRVGGEAFTVFRPNPGLSVVPVDFEVYEGDQFHTPGFLYEQLYNTNEYPPIDGVVLDDWGNPRSYHRLKQHPHGRYSTAATAYDVVNVDAEACVHEFRKERPSQYRGISECLAPLQVYAHIRRFIESKVGQEELRAKLLGVIQSKWAECADIGDEPIEMLIGDGQFLSMPDGWEAEMFRFDATGQGVAEFMRVALSWATMGFLVPWNVASSDSSDYNFASGRLDYLIWNRIVEDRQQDIEKDKINKYFAFFLDFANLRNLIPHGLGTFTYRWHWPEREPIDIKAQSVADTNYAKAGLLDMDRFAQRNRQNAIDMISRKLKLQFEEQRIRNELEEEYGFALSPKQEPTDDQETEGTQNDEKEPANVS